MTQPIHFASQQISPINPGASPACANTTNAPTLLDRFRDAADSHRSTNVKAGQRLGFSPVCSVGNDSRSALDLGAEQAG